LEYEVCIAGDEGEWESNDAAGAAACAGRHCGFLDENKGVVSD
jgi:hypothetical protein